MKHVYNQYTVRATNRDAVRRGLADAGIGSEVYYPIPLHLQECFAFLGYKAGICRTARLASGTGRRIFAD